ncbi:MAG: hypothetical protein ACREFR_18625, partial [Limisphaerales bacterium]
MNRQVRPGYPRDADWLEKAVMARWLRKRWVSQRLEMGHYTRVTQAVGRVARRPSRRHKNLKRKLTDLTGKLSNNLECHNHRIDLFNGHTTRSFSSTVES